MLVGNPDAVRAAAEEAAKRWKNDACDESGFYRLAFDRPGSWSQKYNLVWDRLLGLGLFPADIAETEMAHYRKIQTRYGLPLDSRRSYTKFDWIVWCAVLTGKRDDFEALVAPLYTWLDETPTRVPLCDWYETEDGRQVGFQARSVVGGVFIGMLADPELRKKMKIKENYRSVGIISSRTGAAGQITAVDRKSVV